MSEKEKKKLTISSDVIALTLGAVFVILTVLLWSLANFNFTAVKFAKWANFAELGQNLSEMKFIVTYLYTWIVLSSFFATIEFFRGKAGFFEAFIAFTGIYLLASLVYILSKQSTMSKYLEYAFWSLLIGLIVSNIFKVPDWMKPALQSGTYIKVGLVLMGTEVIFQNIMKFGVYGIAIVAIVIPITFIFMWWFGLGFLKMEDPANVAVITTATAVCGVSAAIAASASVKGKKEDLSITVSVTTIATVVMMVVMPLFAKWVGLSEIVGGAWIGNTVDSTGAVVLAGEAMGPVASDVASIIKMIQNMLIGLISFILAVYFARYDSKKNNLENNSDKEVKSKVKISEIWTRIPKFIFGFIVMSIIFSFVIQPIYGIEITNKLIKTVGSWKGWYFCLTFLCIGLETDFREMLKHAEGGKPVTLYIVGQTFSVILSYLVVEALLGGHFFPVPDLSVLG